MPGGWTDQSERDLLFTIIKLCAPTGMNWDEVSAMMGELGYAYTKEAVRYVTLSLSSHMCSETKITVLFRGYVKMETRVD
jgi:hypothetical protein